MKIIIFIFAVAVSIASVLAKERLKRAAYDLPDATKHLIGPLRKTFVCESNGYYADQDNNCQIFHVCHSYDLDNNAKSRMYQWSFVCGPETMFNQRSLTCTFPKDAVPCDRAHEYFYLNEKLGDPNAKFGNDDNDAPEIDRRSYGIDGNRGGGNRPGRGGSGLNNPNGFNRGGGNRPGGYNAGDGPGEFGGPGGNSRTGGGTLAETEEERSFRSAQELYRKLKEIQDGTEKLSKDVVGYENKRN